MTTDALVVHAFARTYDDIISNGFKARGSRANEELT